MNRPSKTEVVSASATNLPLPGTGRVARKREERIQRILVTTAQVLSGSGYGATSLDEIARRLDVTKASLYHYFDSKEELVSACIDRLAEEAIGQLTVTLRSEGRSATDRLRLLVRRHLIIVMRERPESRVFAAELDWPEAYRIQLKAVRRRYDRIFRDVIEEGLGSGEFHVVSLEAVMHCLWGALNHTPVWYRSGTATSLDKLADEIAETVLMLVGVRAMAKTEDDKVGVDRQGALPLSE